MPEPIAVTAGDPSGVGPEIIVSWARTLTRRDGYLLFGPQRLLDQTGLAGVVCGGSEIPLSDGTPTAAGARSALMALEAAAAACASGKARAVVTGPVSKGALEEVGFNFPGQTEFFAARWGGEPTMAFVGDRLRVVLATWHIPLCEVGSALREDPGLLGRAVSRAGELARRLGASVPRIAVCGLNPHAGEGGLIGSEEMDFLDPQLERLKAVWPGLTSCLPGDTVFYRALEGEFDAIVALYHDQGLAPLKTVEFHQAVNVTLGLPYLRTSPDHGTGFGLAGRGKARSDSFVRAVRLAERLSKQA